MNGKKIKTSVIALALVLCANCAVGCDNEPTPAPGPDEQLVAAIAFGEKTKELTIGDEVYLTPNYQKKDGFVLTYVSDNPSVVSVNENGKITALLEGSATVSAIYSDGTTTDSASITINSSFNGNVPKLVLNHANVDGSVSLAVGSDYQLDVGVSFNSLAFHDATLEYSVEDPTIVGINENGLIDAKKVGETNVIVKGSWRGVDHTSKKTLILTVPVTVKNDVLFLNDGKVVADTSLYTLSSFDGKSYATNMPNKFTVTVDGQEYPATAEIVNGDVAEMGKSVIKAKTYGSTEVVVSSNVNGVDIEKRFTLTVSRPVSVVEGMIYNYCTFLGTWYDAEDGERKPLSDVVSFNGEIVDAYQGKTALKIKEDGIFGITSSARDSRGTAEITVGTATALYEIALETLDNVIAVIDDIKYITQGASSGYWELLNDIDATGYVASYDVSASFAGVFDGKGHTIKNLTIAKNKGIFASVGTTTVIRNLGFENLHASNAFYISPDSPENGFTLDNIYVNLSADTVRPRGLVNYAGSGNAFKNILIEYVGENSLAAPTFDGRDDSFGALVAGLPVTSPDHVAKKRTFDFDKNIDLLWENIYVVSPYILSFNSSQVGDMKYDGSKETTSAVYAYGSNLKNDIFGKSIVTGDYKKSGVQTRTDDDVITGEWASETSKEYYNVRFTKVANYNDRDAMKEAKPEYSFDETYWTVTEDGELFWKSAQA